jgi:uncharacterized protein YggE
MYYVPFNSYQGNINTYPSQYDQKSNERNNSSEKTLTVDGTGVVKLEPDIAVVNLGVETIGKEVSTSQAENSRLSTAMVQAINQMGVDKKDIGTANYLISPEYDFIEGKQVFRGYRVINTYNITIRNLKEVGQIIDVAIKNGANKINNIDFTISNPSPYINRALSLAVKDAFEKAQTIANTLGVELNAIPNSVTEEHVSSAERSSTVTAYLAAPKALIEGGQLEISAGIKSVYNYIP